MGFPLSQERREPPALAELLPLRRQGEVGRGFPRFGLIRKTPLPNPSGHRAQLDGVRQAASQWLASGLPYPLPSQGREQSSRLPPLPCVRTQLAERLLALSTCAQKPATKVRSRASRSEEHTSELQSLMRISYAVFCLTKKN